MSEIKIKACGFSPEEQARIKGFGHVETLASIAPNTITSSFGQGEVVFLNANDPQFHPNTIANTSATLPKDICLYLAPPEGLKNLDTLEKSGLPTVCPPVEQLPNDFVKDLVNFIAGPDRGQALDSLGTQNHKSMHFNSAVEWDTFHTKLSQFLGKFNVDATRTGAIFKKLQSSVVTQHSAFETMMHGEYFMGGVTFLNATNTLESVLHEIIHAMKGSATPPPESPEGIYFTIKQNSDFILVRKGAKWIHLSFVYFLKSKPAYGGFSLRFPQMSSSQAFSTMNPDEISTGLAPHVPAKAPDPILDAPAVDTPMSVTASSATPVVSNVSPAETAATVAAVTAGGDKMIVDMVKENEQLKAELAALHAQLKQFESMNSIYMQANKILGEEIKRLVRTRKEPSTDEELKYARTQLEIKIKKLLVRITQYDAALRENSQKTEKLMEQFKAAEERIKQLDTGT